MGSARRSLTRGSIPKRCAGGSVGWDRSAYPWQKAGYSRRRTARAHRLALASVGYSYKLRAKRLAGLRMGWTTISPQLPRGSLDGMPVGVGKAEGRRRPGRWPCVAAIVTIMGLGGCGGSTQVRRAPTAVGRNSSTCDGAINPLELPPFPLAGPEHRGATRCLGGAYRLAVDRVPEGAEFAIIGQRYTRAGHDYLSLSTHFENPGEVDRGGSGTGGGGPGSGLLEANHEEGCEIHPYAIFYGILTRPSDSVVLRGDGRRFPTRRAALPASLHTAGVLVYGTAAGSRLRVELDGVLMSGSYSHPGPCFTWGERHAERVRIRGLTALTARCLRRRGLTLLPPRYATPYLATRLRCAEEAGAQPETGARS